MSYRSRWRMLGARAAVVTSIAGATIVLTSVIFFFVDNSTGRILAVSLGFIFLAMAVYYAANPFIRNERIYVELRAEVDLFLEITRELHYAAIRGDYDAFESIKERMPGQVETLISTARKSGPDGIRDDELSQHSPGSSAEPPTAPRN